MNLKQCKDMLTEETIKLRQLIKDSVKTREMELREMIQELEAQAEEAANAKAHAIRQILRAEQLKQLYQKLQNLWQSKKGILHKLEIPIDENDNPKEIELQQEKWQVLETEEEIEEALFNRNKKHFGQAEYDKTTFFREPLKSDINYTATTASSDHILHGDYDTSTLDSITTDFVKAMKKRTHWHHLNL